MRSLLIALTLTALSASAAEAQPEERWRLELSITGERHFFTMLAETPEGGEDRVGARLWSGGFDLCPMAPVRAWFHLGGCLGLHVVPGGRDSSFAIDREDQTTNYLARAQLRATFLTPKYIRGGVDLLYRSFLSVGAGRESGLEVGARLGVEFYLGERDTPLVVGVAFRGPLFTTRSDSTYSWPVTDPALGPGTDTRPTREVRVFTLGFFLGSVFSFR